jgi:hypothetical protein
MKFQKKPVVVDAHLWFQNGDHPQDEVYYVLKDRNFVPVTEGKVVRYFRRPDVKGNRQCEHCQHVMHDHGWIDTLEGGHIVCPGDWIITGVKGERYP